ncbi:LTA synthase family protein [Limosilactobacillus mucosae]
MKLKKLTINWFSMLWLTVLLIVTVAVCTTARQMLSHAAGQPFLFLWMIKNTAALSVVVLPMMLGAIELRISHRQTTAILLGTVGLILFGIANHLSQPAILESVPSAERYVVQNIFVTWLAYLALMLFDPWLKKWLHRFKLPWRRRFLIILTLTLWLLNLNHAAGVLGFAGGNSFLWFIYLFALGDWLNNDLPLQKSIRIGWLLAFNLLIFLTTCLTAWFKINQLTYNPHDGLVLTTHYQVAINAFQNNYLLMAILIVLTLVKLLNSRSASGFYGILGGLMLNLLAVPKLLVPFLKYQPDWHLIVAILIVWISTWLLAIFLNQWATRFDWRIGINLTTMLNGLKIALFRYWPLLLTTSIIWGMTIWSFGYLWNWQLNMVQWIIMDHHAIVWANVLIMMALAGILMALTNRWWISSTLTIIIYGGWLIASILKIQAREEPILPTDLATITAPKEMLGMVDPTILIAAGVFVIVLLGFAIVIEIRHGQKCRFRIQWRYLIGALSLLYLSGFALINHTNSPTYRWAEKVDDTPYFYAQLRGAKVNGTLLQFANNVDVRVMDKPKGYSKVRMEKIGQIYLQQAKKINRHRTHATVGNQRLVFILSESFADPRRVPNLKVSGNPVPYLDQLKSHTTSGLMLSTGYGGGTANMEYQALTGLSIVNFSPTMPTPYSQLVPYQKHAVAINQLFSYSDGIHPFTANLYSRVKVYHKFGFNKFYHLDGGSRLSYTHKIDNSPRIDDWSAYQQVLLNLKNHHGNQFIQLATMQNHMPYDNFYHHNNYKVSGTAYRTPQAQQQIETYTQGIHYTDEALKKFISRLDQSSQPTTVVWYGDHLPGIYNGVSMAEHGLVMHETDYFIYSNPAAQRINRGHVDKTKIVSPNEFIPMAMAQMDLKVSPYYALLTQVHEKLPAITLDTSVHSHSNRPHSTAVEYVDQDGLKTSLSLKQMRLFNDYRMVQYDLTAGHHYLLHDWFMLKVPH